MKNTTFRKSILAPAVLGAAALAGYASAADWTMWVRTA